jgi:hypothetical protein
MTIAVKMLNDQIKKISDTNTLLDMLLEFEKVLEDIDVYAYKNWAKGEVLEGPKLSRHYVTVTLVYPQKEMPDPEGAKRLMARDCLVKYHQDELISPVKVRSFDDISTDITPDGQTKHKAKTTEVVEADEDLYVDTESFNTEQVASAETQVTGGNDGA